MAGEVLIALDQLANTLAGGYADETISARAHRNGWRRAERFINWLFRDSQHCADSYRSELLRSQLPSAYRVYAIDRPAPICLTRTDCCTLPKRSDLDS